MPTDPPIPAPASEESTPPVCAPDQIILASETRTPDMVIAALAPLAGRKCDEEYRNVGYPIDAATGKPVVTLHEWRTAWRKALQDK